MRKNAENRCTKGTPLQVLAFAMKKLELALAIINNLSGSSCIFFPFFLVFIVVEWFLIVIACFSKAKTKQTFTKSKNFTLFSQWESHQSLSENRGSQSESNEDPIRAYQKREDLSKPYRSLGEELGFSIYYCKADLPLKKGVDPLYYCRCNIIKIAIFNPLDDGELPVFWAFWIFISQNSWYSEIFGSNKNPQLWRNPSIFAAQLRNPGPSRRLPWPGFGPAQWLPSVRFHHPWCLVNWRVKHREASWSDEETPRKEIFRDLF